MHSLRYTRNLFLRAFCIVYLAAFISYYIQIPGLYGDNGILPARSVLENSKHKTLSAKVHYQPTLLWLAPYLGLDTNYALDVLALLGSFLAFTGFVSQKFCTIPLFAALWSLYFSLYQVGQVFVSTNYDDLLLEAGFLALLVAPLLPGKRKGARGSPVDHISLWLVRSLLFRFLLTNGLAKFISGCPKWWGMTAFKHYFETEPLPTPLSWYFHQVPEMYLRLFSIVANVWEIVIPFLFFVPIRCVRIVAFGLQIYLQISVVLTGNFNFVNVLLVTIMLSLLDDQFFYGNKKQSNKRSWLSLIACLIIYAALVFGVIHFYSLVIHGTTIESKIAFTKEQFNYVLKNGLMIVVLFGLFSVCATIVRALFNSVSVSMLTTIKTVIYSGIAIFIFYANTVPLESLEPSINTTIHFSARRIYNRLHKLHAVNQYGLFPKMIDQRLEIILEGSNNIEGPWIEYNFLYKPGNVNHSLPYVAPYTPRLDWQMYWAAYSTYEKQPWLLSLAHRLLLGNSEVLSLFDRNHLPFNDKAPKYIRASLYKYKYTAWSKRSDATWWIRERVGDYFPAYSKDSTWLIDYLKARNLLPITTKSNVNIYIKQILDNIRFVTGHLEATLLLWSVFTAGCAIITTSAK